MVQSTVRKPAETLEQARRRLARQAIEKGVDLYQVSATGERFATSISRPGELHRLTHEACDCEGFCRHRRCGHHSLLLAELGWLSLDEDAPAALSVVPATVECSVCCGRGWFYVESPGGYLPAKLDCHRCGTAGRMPAKPTTIPTGADRVVAIRAAA